MRTAPCCLLHSHLIYDKTSSLLISLSFFLCLSKFLQKEKPVINLRVLLSNSREEKKKGQRCKKMISLGTSLQFSFSFNKSNQSTKSAVPCPSNGSYSSHVAQHHLFLIRPCTGKPASTFSDRPCNWDWFFFFFFLFYYLLLQYKKQSNSNMKNK